MNIYPYPFWLKPMILASQLLLGGPKPCQHSGLLLSSQFRLLLLFPSCPYWLRLLM